MGQGALLGNGGRCSLGKGAGQGKGVGAGDCGFAYHPIGIGAGAAMTGAEVAGWWRAAAALLAALAAMPPAALATGSVECRGLDGAPASVSLTLAPLPVPAVLFVRIESNGQRWSTAPGEAAQAVTLAQTFTTDDAIVVDLVDDQFTRRVASLRVLRVEEGRRIHQYGYLQLHGLTVHPLACEGP
jgi:hypothetical protein